MKYYVYSYIGIILIVVAVFGVRGTKFSSPPIEIFPDMDRQLKYKAQQPTGFYSDGRIERLPVEGTVPFGLPVDNPYLMTGKMGANWGDGIPVEVSESLMARGKQRYEINCAVCHGGTGMGNGITSQFGLVGIANLHQDRIQKMPDGQIYNTIVHGKNLMGGYPHLSLEDRWAIVAYLRALQRTRNASVADVPSDVLKTMSVE